MENFDTHNLKSIETYGEIWKHFETHNLKTIEKYGEIWKHPTELWSPMCDNWNLGFSIGTQIKHLCAPMHGEKSAFFMLLKV